MKTKTYRIESDVKTEIKRQLKELGAWYTMPFMSGYGKQGIPDFLVCYRGSFIGIEAKLDDYEGSPAQEAQMTAIREAGGLTAVVNQHNVNNFTSFIVTNAGPDDYDEIENTQC